MNARTPDPAPVPGRENASGPADMALREAELRRSNRALRTLSSCNQVLIQATDEAQLLNEVCRVIVEHGGYRMAWVGFAENDPARTVRPVASAGYEAGYLETVHITWADEPRGRGPTGTAIRTRQPAVCRDMHSDPRFAPWREDALRRGYSASIVLPLLDKESVLGAISIYATEPSAFDAEEVNLLQELAADLVFGVLALRVRVAHREAERQMRDALAEAQRFRQALDRVNAYVYIKDADSRYVYANQPTLNLFKCTAADLPGRGDADFFPPDTVRQLRALDLRVIAGESSASEVTVGGGDGSQRTYWEVKTPLRLENAGRSGPGLLGISTDITALKHTEAEIRHREQELRQAQRIALIGGWRMDLATQQVTLSEELCRVLGLDQTAPAPRFAELRALFTPESWERLNLALEQTRRTGAAEDPELEFIRPDGTRGWLLVRGEVLRDERDEVTGFLGVAQDITTRKETEIKGRERELELRLAQRIAHVGSWQLDLTSGRVVWSEELYRMLGLDPAGPPPEVAEHPRLFTPESWERLHRALELAREAGTSYELELEMIRADGRRGWMFARGEAQRDEQGRITRLRGVAQDITTRKEAEAEFRKQQTLFESLVSTIPDRLYFKDRESRFVLINDLMAREAGLASAADAVGKTDTDLFGPEHARQAYADEQRIMATGRPMLDYEEKENWRDGRVTWVSTTKVPLRDTQGKITGLVGISRDITERKNLEARYLQAQKMEAFGQLAGGVAHDFNNILGVMLMQINLLQLERGLSGKLVSGLAELERYAMRGAGLTRQLLLFSRRQDMESRVLDLRTVLEDTAKMLRRVLGEHIAFELQNAPEALWIDADPGMMEQVLMNLCINARDAMPSGGRLTVVTSAETRPSPGSATAIRHACLVVRDTGCGMSEATKARIFEPFFTTKPAGKGTGLGLATVYGIVQQHHGWIEVESAPGSGTTFRIYFPFRDQQAAVSGPAERKRIPGGKESVLVVEDEENLRTAVCMALELAGYRVREAANGPEALHKWEEGRQDFDLLLTDYLMPEGMTGAQLAAQLTRAKPGLKAIIMTGYVPGGSDSATPWPSDVVRLNKPFEANRLLQAVRDCLDAKATN